MLDENVSWQEHICTVKNKIAKNIVLLFHGKYLLNELSLKCIYFDYKHLYLNYANIAWASTYQTKLKAIHLLQNMTHSRPLLRSLNALNVYQIFFFQYL